MAVPIKVPDTWAKPLSMCQHQLLSDSSDALANRMEQENLPAEPCLHFWPPESWANTMEWFKSPCLGFFIVWWKINQNRTFATFQNQNKQQHRRLSKKWICSKLPQIYHCDPQTASQFLPANNNGNTETASSLDRDPLPEFTWRIAVYSHVVRHYKSPMGKPW